MNGCAPGLALKERLTRFFSTTFIYSFVDSVTKSLLVFGTGNLIQLYNRPFPNYHLASFSKRPLVLILSFENEISFTCKLNSFS